MSLTYKEIIKSKDNLDIPVFQNGKTMHSKYSPLKEAESFGNNLNKNVGFAVVLGLGGGYHIMSLLKKNPALTILVIENSSDDIQFLNSIKLVKELSQDKRIIFSSCDNFEKILLTTYVPAFYSDINVLSNRAWFDNNIKTAQEILSKIEKTIKLCSKDYSVQAHFGFIWQKNIIINLKNAKDLNFNVFNYITQNVIQNDSKDDIKNCTKNYAKKTAIVIAAGPSLDYKIDELIKNRDLYFIIATDTALSILSKYKIFCDCVVSIDGQNISYKHFVGTCNKNTMFIFDLQANFNAVHQAKKLSKKICFVKSRHPFCEYSISTQENYFNFIKLECGSGTVTIAAVDFARVLGFSNITVLGADFSYTFNKPYAKGTYLDCLYHFEETKINPAENCFTKLMFRTELNRTKINFKNQYFTQLTSEVLNSYKTSFTNWLKQNNFYFTNENFEYKITVPKNSTQTNTKLFNYENFVKILKSDITKSLQKNLNHDKPLLFNDLSPLEISLLPYIAYLRRKNPNLDFTQILNLALTKILEYT